MKILTELQLARMNRACIADKRNKNKKEKQTKEYAAIIILHNEITYVRLYCFHYAIGCREGES